jgi:solute carrier family 35 protein
MLTALRRFTILLTMMLEQYYGLITPTAGVKFSVFLMIFGAMVAAASDLAFDLEGYIMIFLNDVFTALNGVVMKKTLVNKKINKMGVLFHNSWIGCVLAPLYSSTPCPMPTSTGCHSI